MAINPTLQDVAYGDIFVSDVKLIEGEPVVYISTVVDCGRICVDGDDRMLIVQEQDHNGRYTAYEGKHIMYSKILAKPLDSSFIVDL